MKKILFVFVLAIFFLIPASAKTKKKYLALGDSITYGYGLENRDENFATLFSKKYDLELTNEAISGDKSGVLLEKLSNYNINDYDVITLCIGANDILKEFLDDIEGLSALDTINYILNIENNEDFNRRVNENLITFEENLKQIMEILYKGHAQIYLMNVYNPYNRFSVEELDKQANKYINKLNEIIDKYNKDTYFINLYKKFNKTKKEVINSQTTRSGYTADPHPSPEGHKYIAELLGNEYELHNYEIKNIILTIIFGVLVILLELIEMIYTIKKFSIKSANNIDIKPKIEEKEVTKEGSSRFIRS